MDAATIAAVFNEFAKLKVELDTLNAKRKALVSRMGQLEVDIATYLTAMNSSAIKYQDKTYILEKKTIGGKLNAKAQTAYIRQYLTELGVRDDKIDVLFNGLKREPIVKNKIAIQD